MKRAVFLDRDGTLLDELGFLRRPEDLRLLPGAAEGVRLINQAGWSAVLVTNQSGIARGLFGEPELAAVHARLRAELAAHGAHLDGLFHCPHHPDEGVGALRRSCTCRKPAPGMLLEAAERLGLALAASWTVGDSQRDLEAGRRAGLAGGVLVLTGKGQAELALFPADDMPLTAPDLPAAVGRILTLAGDPRPGGSVRQGR